MRVSTSLGLAVCLGVVSFSAGAFAQSDPIGAGGRLILSGDRLTGVSFSKVRMEDGDNGGVSTQSRTDVSFLWRPRVVSPYDVPQVGIDVGVVAGLTLGGSLGFLTESGTDEDEPAGGGASVSRDLPSITGLLFAPRVGYGIPILPWLAFWGRLGITYYSLQTSQTSAGNNPTSSESGSTGIGLNVDPMLVFVPAKHFGITVGPYLDLPLSGSTSSEITVNGVTTSPPDDSTKFTSFGLKVGLLGAFL